MDSFTGFSEIMVDIETLGTKPGCVVLSIGAVAFNLQDNNSYDDLTDSRCFYAVLKQDVQEKAGLLTDPKTLQWWREQDVLARQVLDAKGYEPVDVLQSFGRFCAGTERLWGNGNTFDNMILRKTYEVFNVEYPYAFWQDLDLRTLVFAAQVNKQNLHIPKGIAHNALDDAKYQVLVAQHCWRQLHRTQEYRYSA